MKSSRVGKLFYLLVGVSAAVVLISLVAAGCWVALHDGFGVGDLYALTFWSVPFGAVVATVGIVLKSSARPRVRALRVFGAAGVGALLGLLWTLLMVQMMGPWFGTFSFPVLPILASSGALTLGVIATYQPKSLTKA